MTAVADVRVWNTKKRRGEAERDSQKDQKIRRNPSDLLTFL